MIGGLTNIGDVEGGGAAGAITIGLVSDPFV